MTLCHVTADIEPHLDWNAALESIAKGHALPVAQIDDTFLYQRKDTLLSRAAWIDGLGALVKTAMVFPDNPARDLPAVNGSVALYSDRDGQLEAILDFHLVTKWKTAADSLFAAQHLARPDSHRITLVGAGTVARSMYDAYRAIFPQAQFTIWARNSDSAALFARDLENIRAEADLEKAVTSADIICTATMSKTPLIKGDWLRPGQHLDLIGAFRPDMREVDDAALCRAALFVDSRATTLDHIGELKDPIARGVIDKADIQADYYDFPTGKFKRPAEDSITICKNGGGAHLDLMISHYIFQTWHAQQQ